MFFSVSHSGWRMQKGYEIGSEKSLGTVGSKFLCLSVPIRLATIHGVLAIGSPEQIFRVLLHTGTSTTWVTSVDSDIPSRNYRSTFNPKGSLTGRSIMSFFEEAYGPCRISGTIYVDNMKGFEMGIRKLTNWKVLLAQFLRLPIFFS
ncbi:hypothetical protein T265_07087 [Opisthorchis viverrini]|uniref:Peptidase A1 domain-containing protein n=1 Tax=Opisthorchis viverrini TaxID=6198 RepID=A0A074ZE63_OPIVI|nr:hypothetical protein T265_07087 [Opisthorchis viverrini]KER25463.1 hypothetical protein T265_07087 [Opisthorchis viverrini]